jgi:hypothetical protein
MQSTLFSCKKWLQMIVCFLVLLVVHNIILAITQIDFLLVIHYLSFDHSQFHLDSHIIDYFLVIHDFFPSCS